MLIFNVREWDWERREVTVSLMSEDATEIAAGFQGERVALGVLPEPERRTVWGSGVLAGYGSRGKATSFFITNTVVLPRLHSLRRPAVDDSSAAPYGLDVLEEEEANAIFGDLSLLARSKVLGLRRPNNLRRA